MMSCPELNSLECFNNFPVFWQEKLNEQLKKLNSLNKYKSVDLQINMGLYKEFVPGVAWFGFPHLRRLFVRSRRLLLT